MKKNLIASLFLALAIIFSFVLLLSDEKPAKIAFSDLNTQVTTNLSATVADSDKKRQTGLMFRDNLPDDEGMLFIFNGLQKHSMWMKNMQFPIDLIFLNEKKEIIKIYENLPPCENLNCPSYPSEEPAVYAIEINAGFIANHQINSTTKIDFDIDKK